MSSKRIVLSLAVVSVLVVAGIAWTELAHRPREVVLRVDGMVCAGCAATIRESLEQLPGTSDIVISHEDGQVSLTIDGWSKTTREDIKAAIEAAGGEFRVRE